VGEGWHHWQIVCVQALETVQSRGKNVLRSYHLQSKGEVLTGRSVGESIGQGKATVILDANNLDHFRDGEVLVTDGTDWGTDSEKASAIVTNQGTCRHAAIMRGSWASQPL